MENVLIWIGEVTAIVARHLQVRDENRVSGNAVPADDKVVGDDPGDAAGDRDLAEGLLDAGGEVFHLTDARLR